MADTALLLDVTAGPDIRDPVALPATDIFYEDVVRDASIRGLRVAYSPDLGQGMVARDVLGAIDEALDVLRELGADVTEVEIELPDTLEYFGTGGRRPSRSPSSASWRRARCPSFGPRDHA